MLPETRKRRTDETKHLHKIIIYVCIVCFLMTEQLVYKILTINQDCNSDYYIIMLVPIPFSVLIYITLLAFFDIPFPFHEY